MFTPVNFIKSDYSQGDILHSFVFPKFF